MKQFPAGQVESSGDDKTYLPAERIGVLKRGDTYYVFEAGDEQVMADMLAPSAEDVLAEAKGMKYARIEADFQAAIAAGITVSGITLAANDSDRARFVELLTLLREANAPEDMPVTIADIAGTTHRVTVADLRRIMVQYGLAVQANWTTKAARLQAVQNAATIDAVGAV